MAEDIFTKTETVKESILDSLVGDGKKFATADALAEGKQEADSFIEQLQGELKGVREDLAKADVKEGDSKTIADLIKVVNDSQTNRGTDDTNQMSEEDLSNKIKSVLQGESTAATAAENREKGNELVLAKVDGNVEAAQAYVATRAKQLSMTTDELAALSEKSPSAFAKLIELDPSTVQQGIAPLDGLNSDTLDQKIPTKVIDGHHTKAYFDALKKEMGAGKYWGDRKIQGEYYEAAMALEDRFNQ